jgi:hypothetical protein
MGDLDELGDLRDARDQRNGFAGAPPRPAASVPLFIRRVEAVQHLLGQAELLREGAGEVGMRGDVHLAMAGDHELEAKAEPVQRRRPGAQHP